MKFYSLFIPCLFCVNIFVSHSFIIPSFKILHYYEYIKFNTIFFYFSCVRDSVRCLTCSSLLKALHKMCCGCLYTVSLPHGAVCWSAVCDCGIYWSYSLTFFCINFVKLRGLCATENDRMVHIMYI